MISLDWQILDREQANSIIDKIASTDIPALFTKNTAEVRTATLPFYEKLFVYRITNYGTLPSFSMDFLGDGKSYFYLNGSKDVLSNVNDNEALKLKEDMLPYYLDYYFSYVSEESESIDVLSIYDEDDDKPDHNFDAAIKNWHNTAEVTFDEDEKVFHVDTVLLYGGNICKAHLNVTEHGAVEVLSVQAAYPDNDNVDEEELGALEDAESSH